MQLALLRLGESQTLLPRVLDLLLVPFGQHGSSEVCECGDRHRGAPETQVRNQYCLDLRKLFI